MAEQQNVLEDDALEPLVSFSSVELFINLLVHDLRAEHT
jgi:hypothetical protein